MNISWDLNNSTAGNHSWSEGSTIGWQDWGWWTKQILTPVIVLVGITGNSLSFWLMKTPTVRHNSYSNFLCALAIFDSITLIGRQLVLIDEMMNYCGSTGFRALSSDLWCKMYTFCEHISYLMSSWLIVVLSIERIFAIYYPFKKRVVCKARLAVIVIFVLLGIISCTQVFRLIMIGKDDKECVANENYILTYVMLHTYFYQICLLFVLPVSIVLVCNGLILSKIRKLRQAVLCGNDTNDQQYRYSTRFRKTTFTLLTISFVYVICTLPMIIITFTFILVWEIYGVGSSKFLFALKPYGDVLEVVFILNFSVNFFIYVFSGKLFRNKFASLFQCHYGSAIMSACTHESRALTTVLPGLRHQASRGMALQKIIAV